MKKSILALAVLGAFAGAASAQSSVTIYGKLNLEAGKATGRADKALMDVAGSRLGFRGVEDLGGGLKATFGMEHRFDPASGADATGGAKFWQGYSTVGLMGNFGHVRVGRDYVVGFLMVQNQIDPFGGDTVSALRNIGLIANSTGAAGAGKVRYDNELSYHFSASGFNFGAQIAEAVANNGGTAKRPYALAGNYAAGPLFAGLAYENGGDADDKVLSVGARYNFGVATVSAGYSTGTNAAGVDQKGAMVGANFPMGAADIKVGYAVSSAANLNGRFTKLGLGVHYNLSKRTKVFADFARIGGDERTAAQKSESNGYDFGIQHNF